VATYTFNATSNHGYISSINGSYSSTRSGSGLTAYTASAIAIAGQYENPAGGPSQYIAYEGFIEFDTAILSGKTLTSAVLKLYVNTMVADIAFTLEARIKDYGTGVTTADWVAGGSLSALTLVAQIASSAVTVGAVNTLSDVALPANVNKTGKTRIILSTNNLRLGNVPASAIEEYLFIDSYLGSAKPQLVVETAEPTGQLTATLATDTMSSTGVLELKGNVAATLADDTLTALGALSSTGAGSLVSTLANDTIAITVKTTTQGYCEVTLADDTLTTVALVPINGNLTATLADATLEAIGGKPISGTLTVTLADATLSTSTLGGINGALTATLADAVLAAAESTPSWPTVYSFPQSPLDGTWTPSLGDDTLRSEREVGARQTRNRNSGNYAQADFAIFLKRDVHRLELDRFFADDCKSGARPFYWRDPETGDIKKWTWAAPPVFNHAGLQNYIVECSLRKEAA
jgi:hypothetical protein